MKYQHRDLQGGRWKKLTIIQKLANIGSEVERAINWKKKNNIEYSRQAIYRALELLDLTLASEKGYYRLREIARIRELVVDYFFYDNIYKSSDILWQKFFYPYFFAARNI